MGASLGMGLGRTAQCLLFILFMIALAFVALWIIKVIRGLAWVRTHPNMFVFVREFSRAHNLRTSDVRKIFIHAKLGRSNFGMIIAHFDGTDEEILRAHEAWKQDVPDPDA
jgi:hypothetical protein